MPIASDLVLSVRSVSKKFTRKLSRSLYYGVRDILAELGGQSRQSDKLRRGEFWALNNIDFDLRRGEALGLVGANGSGKTTLLRLISGLIKLDTGQISMQGRLAPLIALGAGFNPVLTGRENIYVNMAILGLPHAAIRERLNDVVEFAELGDAIDAPLQTYSSGMAARLGFASAVHTAPDILLVDEVLSVGDMRFRAKCYRKLSQLRESGTSFILVSHNSAAVLSVSDRVLYLRSGKQVMCGDPEEALTRYEADLYRGAHERASLLLAKANANKETSNSTGLQISEIFLSGDNGERLKELRSGESGAIHVRVQAERPLREVVLSLLIREIVDDMLVVQNLSSERDGSTFDLEHGVNSIVLDFPACHFRSGLFTAKIFLTSRTYYTYDAVESFVFRVTSERHMNQCSFYQPRKWTQLKVRDSVLPK